NVEVEVMCEREMCPYCDNRNGDEFCVEFLELRHHHRVQGQLVRAYRTPVCRIEGKNHRLAAEIFERYFLVWSAIEREVRGLPARAKDAGTLPFLFRLRLLSLRSADSMFTILL